MPGEAPLLKPRNRVPGTSSVASAALSVHPSFSSFAARTGIRETFLLKINVPFGKFGPVLRFSPHLSSFHNDLHVS